jgi:hypothetical protein
MQIVVHIGDSAAAMNCRWVSDIIWRSSGSVIVRW